MKNTNLSRHGGEGLGFNDDGARRRNGIGRNARGKGNLGGGGEFGKLMKQKNKKKKMPKINSVG